jgi:hypothetical protein
MNLLEGRPVVRSPEDLRLHQALRELAMIDPVGELNAAARLKGQSIPEPILISADGTILAGFGRWRLAILESRQNINCVEYLLSEEESLQFILAHHQPQNRWNAFIRIRVALTLEPYLQQRAIDNMRAGGKYKGSANLPEARLIDVRQEIARVAGVGARNVSNVRTILRTAHPRLIDALQDGTLTIYRVSQWCTRSKAQQMEQFTKYTLECATSKVIRESITRLKKATMDPDVIAVLDAVQRHEARQPGSVGVRVSRLQRTVVLVGQDLSTCLHSQGVLLLK